VKPETPTLLQLGRGRWGSQRNRKTRKAAIDGKRVTSEKTVKGETPAREREEQGKAPFTGATESGTSVVIQCRRESQHTLFEITEGGGRGRAEQKVRDYPFRVTETAEVHRLGQH